MSNEHAVIADWTTVLANLESDGQMTNQVLGFLSLVQPKGIIGDTLYLEAKDDLTRNMLVTRAKQTLEQAIAKQWSGVRTFAIVVNPEMDAPTHTYANKSEATPSQGFAPRNQPPAAPQLGLGLGSSARPQPATTADTPEFETSSRLNTKYNFDNYVIGGSNRFAHAAAFAVAEAPAKAYNPLFIYGESGLGKTHLLHAVGLYARHLYPKIRVRYVSSEEFTNDFINSIQSNETAEFQTRYRKVDILLIDDIQFLRGRASTQEAFFHTFNDLHDHNKQVVITCDVHPRQLTGFEDRMRSRFEWGLITDVQAPDLETRIAILRSKAQMDNLEIDPEVLEFIASKVSSNIRELEGMLIRVTAFASLHKQPVSMGLVETVMKDVISLDDNHITSPADIIAQTANYFGLAPLDLEGSSRSQPIAQARQIAMYLCREMTNLSLPKIGEVFGGRDHTTVMYANRKIGDLIKEKITVYNQVTEISSLIRESQQFRR